ncbi:fumarylacetoacetate hydrolase family protein [Polaromonas glacialis]|uniref:fumarylacetoacetate hydrolase family protein n=1 Tax=Polaromonas glacialis TaxID=866564 RepID=UPI00049518FF|nr:fumarylacetoacetate hydrolase family protein [Polaromonas glacialis]
MRFLNFKQGSQPGMAVADGAQFRGLFSSDAGFPGDLQSLLAQGPQALQEAAEALRQGPVIDLDTITYLPPLENPGRIFCIGLNYVDHSVESGFAVPTYPAIFSRFAASMTGHGEPIVRPKVSTQLDYEGELVAVIGKAGRYITKEQALDHVAGYSICNDASIRDYQFKSAQWTIGKNFDDTGPFGPHFVTSDELPPGAAGLKIQTRLNGVVVQDASTSSLIFDVATLVSLLSEAVCLQPGDVIVTGTPSGVGLARKPPLFMKHGDVCEVEIEGLGILRNPVVDEQ